MPFATIPAAEQATRRDRRVIVAVVAAIVLVIAGVATWAAIRPGSYDVSRNGCITVNLPGPMGGGIVHQCGSAARSTCQHAFAASDQTSRLYQVQCRLAGLKPS
jgi:predicted metal-binding membrane protein